MYEILNESLENVICSRWCVIIRGAVNFYYLKKKLTRFEKYLQGNILPFHCFTHLGEAQYIDKIGRLPI